MTVPGGGDVGTVPVPTWFGRHEHNVFLDANEDGIRRPGEVGLPDKVVNLRFRDGTVEQSFPTDTEGFVPFDQMFPSGSWQVAEIDFARFKPTGVTVTVDGGGDVSGGPYPGSAQSAQVSRAVRLRRTETGPVLLEGFQSQPGMTSIFEWGKAPYASGRTVGSRGSSTTPRRVARTTRGSPSATPGSRASPTSRSACTARWQRVTGGTALALVQEVKTDSWDAATPTGCPGEITAQSPSSILDTRRRRDAVL